MTIAVLPAQLPDDVESLKAIVQQLHDALHASQGRVEQLEHQLQQLLKARYGPRAERMDPAQMLLFARELLEQSANPPVPPEEVEPEAPPRPTRRGHGRKPLPENLERKRIVHDLSEEEKRCPCCGEMRVKIGEETSEQIEYVPASVFVIEHVRPTYACRKCEGNVETASKPPQPIERGLAGPGLLAQVITSKYCDHLPLYRQEDILARHGIEIARSTMWGWMSSCAWLLKPLYQRMKELLLQSKVIQTDDTPVPVLDPKRGKTRQGRIWVYVGDKNHPYTVYDYTPTRSRDGPAEFFGAYAGYIQADAYGGYDHLFLPRADGKPAPTEVGCWAHARRYFVESERTDALRSCTAVAMIRLLYDVEDEARPLTSEHRYELRQEKSLPRLEQIKSWLEEQKPAVLPKSPIAEAVSYCLNHWEALLRYTQDGDLNIDNNASENALRPFALGRKNWLFAGSDNGGHAAATLASLVASCKRHHLDPFAYLRDVLTRISATPLSQLDQFLPDRWKAARLGRITDTAPT